MGSRRDAEITVGADASQVERAAAAAKAAWKDAGESIKEAFGSATRTIVTGLGEVALAQGKVNFAAQHAQVREFEASSARLAVAMGRDLTSVRNELEQTGVAIGKRPQEVAAWATELNKLTYGAGDATESIRAMTGLAAETGRSAEDYRGLAVELTTVGHAAGDTANVIGVMQAQAEKLGTVGGIAAFADQVQGLQEVISRFAVSSERDFLKVTALAGALGKGLSPAAAARVQQGAFGALASDPLKWERYLGHEITDEHGQIKDPAKVLQEITEKTKRRYGGDARRVLMLNFGAETGAAMNAAHFDEAAKAAGLGASGAAGAAQQRLLDTDAGRRQVAEAQLAESSRALLGSSTLLGRAADALQKFSAHNPIAGTFAATMGSAALATFMSKQTGAGGLIEQLTPGISTFRGLGKGAGALGGLAKGVGSGVAVLGAAAGGYELGSALDETLGISNWISGTTESGTGYSRLKGGSNAQFATDVAANQGRIAAIRRSNAALRSLTTAGSADFGGLTAEDALAARTASSHVVQSNAALATGGEAAIPALVAKLRKGNKDMSDAAAEKIARAVAAALKNVKIVNASSGPVEVSTEASYSAAAGGQSGG